GIPLPVVGPGPLDQALVLGQQRVEPGDRRLGGGAGLGVGGGGDEPRGGGADVLLVAVAGGGRLLPAGQEPAGGSGVGVRQRAVDVGGAGAERLAAVQHVVGSRRALAGLVGGDRAERDDQQGEYGADDAQPPRLGGRGGPHLVDALGE